MTKIALPETFPNLPASVRKIQKLFAGGSVEVATLLALLESEPFLSANILKLVNSPYYALNAKISSLHSAVMLLGTTVIRGIIMATILKKSFPLDLSAYALSLEQFENVSLMRSKLLKEWLKDTDVDIQTLLLGAILMESGKVVLAYEISKNNLVDEFVALRERLTEGEAEERLFGIQSYGAASLLFRQWLFDEPFCDLIAQIANPINDEEKLLHTLQIAVDIHEGCTPKSIQRAQEYVNTHGLFAKPFAQSIEKFNLF